MPSFRLDPYLWVHLAGLAAVPIWLDICLLGLAAGSPVLPVGVEIIILTLLGALPVLWMQWQKPFCIYSLVLLALRPAALDESQRQTLRLFRGTTVRLISLLVPVPLVLALWKLYEIAPVAAESTPFPNRTVGFLAAAIAFLMANLFTQVPASVLKVLLTSEKAWAKRTPYMPEEVARNFTLLGLPVKKILPVLTQPAPGSIQRSPVDTPEETVFQDEDVSEDFDFPDQDQEFFEASTVEDPVTDDWTEADVSAEAAGDAAEASSFSPEKADATGEASENAKVTDPVEAETNNEPIVTEFSESQVPSDQDLHPVIEAEFLNEAALDEGEPVKTFSNHGDAISEAEELEDEEVEIFDNESLSDSAEAEINHPEVIATDQPEIVNESELSAVDQAEAEQLHDDSVVEERNSFNDPEDNFSEK